MDKKTQINGWYLVAAMFALLAIQHWWISSQQVETIPYSQFEKLAEAGKIQNVRVTDKVITGMLKETPSDGRQRFVTVRVDPMLAKQLADRGITVEGASENTIIRDLLSWIVSGAIRPPILIHSGHP